MKYEEATKALLMAMPDFRPEADNLDLPYIIAGDFAEFLHEMYKQGNLDTVKRGLLFIEGLHNSNDEKTRELATVGYLEGIQNIWGDNGLAPGEIYSLLGTESQKWWHELDKFWSGQIAYIGESYKK